jgi:hypothetical protein
MRMPCYHIKAYSDIREIGAFFATMIGDILPKKFKLCKNDQLSPFFPFKHKKQMIFSSVVIIWKRRGEGQAVAG